jgi:hypothetical protein
VLSFVVAGAVPECLLSEVKRHHTAWPVDVEYDTSIASMCRPTSSTCSLVVQLLMHVQRHLCCCPWVQLALNFVLGQQRRQFPPPFAGDVVKEDDVIAQIETDKVTIDVKFTGKAGKITTLAVAEGDTVVVGQKVAEFEEGDFGGSAPAAAAAAPEPEAAAAPPPPEQQPAAAAAQPPSPPPTPKAQPPAAPKVSCQGQVFVEP